VERPLGVAFFTTSTAKINSLLCLVLVLSSRSKLPEWGPTEIEPQQGKYFFPLCPQFRRRSTQPAVQHWTKILSFFPLIQIRVSPERKNTWAHTAWGS